MSIEHSPTEQKVLWETILLQSRIGPYRKRKNTQGKQGKKKGNKVKRQGRELRESYACIMYPI